MSRTLAVRTAAAIRVQHAAAVALILDQRRRGIAPNPDAPIPAAPPVA